VLTCFVRSYYVSKVLAERAAHDFIKNEKVSVVGQVHGCLSADSLRAAQLYDQHDPGECCRLHFKPTRHLLSSQPNANFGDMIPCATGTSTGGWSQAVADGQDMNQIDPRA
jgi:hypothetical protein